MTLASHVTEAVTSLKDDQTDWVFGESIRDSWWAGMESVKPTLEDENFMANPNYKDRYTSVSGSLNSLCYIFFQENPQ